ncbi:RNA-binding domain-containing protein [Phanerochaete sordida]|uniref:RNA-binding domain-containing protein n=1 Tax=Phanerochaete sordida TaxID=48140 RepID=A0A9P3G7A9_9APHY|nr:RNA-binding domain-containing protein [Phanerochaete sordida]
MLLQVDFLPDYTTEAEIEELFSQFGKVEGVMLRQTSRVDRFFGRAFVKMSREPEARKAFREASRKGLILKGECLAIEVVHRPPDATHTLFVLGVQGEVEEVEEEVRELFSPFGEIKHINYSAGNRYCHVVFSTVGAAERAVASHMKYRLRFWNKELLIDFSFHTPSRVLHITDFVGSVKYLCAFFREYIDYVDWVNVSNAEGAMDKPSRAWVQFDTADHASDVRDILRDYGMSVLYSNQLSYPEDWKVLPPSYKTLVDYAPSDKERMLAPARALKKLEALVKKPPELHTFVLHLQHVHQSANREQIEDMLRSAGVTERFTVHLINHSLSGEFAGRALVSFESKSDATLVKEVHQQQPLKIQDKAVRINTALLPKLNDSSAFLALDRVNELDTNALKLVEQWCTTHGKVARFWRGTDTNYYIEFENVAQALRALEAHALHPLAVQGRKIRLNFAPLPDAGSEDSVFRKIVWDA